MSLSLGIWVAVALAKVVALAATWRPNLDRGLLCVRWYLVLSLVADAVTFYTLWHYGYRSFEYKYAYYDADLAVAVLGFFVLVRLVELAFAHSTLRLSGLRPVAIMLFSGVATCSAAIVYLMRGSVSTTSLAFEMQQNFSFLGMVLAALLFVGLNVLQVPGVRFRRIVLSFSLLYSADAIVHSLTAILPGFFAIAYYIVPVIGLVAMGLIAYSLLVPEPQRQMAKSAPGLAPVSGASW